MSLEVPRFDTDFNWWNLKSTLEGWFFRFQNIQSLVPAGAIIEYAGATPPPGWLEADGEEYPTEQYPELAKVIGVESSPGNFEVPDASSDPPTVGAIWIIKV